ncbi:MAG: YdcF family protein [Endozoicomonas sp.]
MGSVLRGIIKQSLLPLLLILWMLMAGLIFKPFTSWLPWLALSLLYLLSIAPVANFLIRGLETYPPLDLQQCQNADAIVVLGAGYPRYSPELPGYQPTAMSLERIRYAAILQRKCKLPVLTSGGGSRPEAVSMADTLNRDYGIDVTWQEQHSLTTWENALYSRKMLGDGKKRVIVVTHAWHMPRAVLSFRRAGFSVIPAPTAFRYEGIPWQQFSYWLPRSRHLQTTELALHEYLGMVWYWLTSKSSEKQ